MAAKFIYLVLIVGLLALLGSFRIDPNSASAVNNYESTLLVIIAVLTLSGFLLRRIRRSDRNKKAGKETVLATIVREWPFIVFVVVCIFALFWMSQGNFSWLGPPVPIIPMY